MAKNNESPRATYCYDPYRNFEFRVKWDGKYVAGITKVSGIERTTEVITPRAEDDPSTPRHTPGQSAYAAITLERGVTHDLTFQQWANRVWYYQDSTIDGQDVSPRDFRKDLVLEVYNEAGQKVIAYKIYRCWPSDFIALPELDAQGSAVVIQTLVIENEGWERDTSVAEPQEPSYKLPPPGP